MNELKEYEEVLHIIAEIAGTAIDAMRRAGDSEEALELLAGRTLEVGIALGRISMRRQLNEQRRTK